MTTRRGLVRRLLAALGWVVTIAVVAALGFSYALPQRLTDGDSDYLALATVAFFGRVFTFQAGLLLATAAVAAALLRRQWLTLTAAIAAAVALAPTAVSVLTRHPPPPAGPAVRVMAMNTKYTNHDGPDVVAQVRRFHPDVLTVEEFRRPGPRRPRCGPGGRLPLPLPPPRRRRRLGRLLPPPVRRPALR